VNVLVVDKLIAKLADSLKRQEAKVLETRDQLEAAQAMRASIVGAPKK